VRLHLPEPTATARLVVTIGVLALAAAAAAQSTQPTIEFFEWIGYPDAAESPIDAAVNDWGDVVVTATSGFVTKGYVRVNENEWGALPSYSGTALAVNNLAHTVGWRSTSEGAGVHAFRWHPADGLFDFAAIEPPDAVGSRAADINDAGVIAGRVFVDIGGTQVAWPFRYDGTLHVLEGTVMNGEPMAINDQGVMVARAYENGRNELYLIDPDDSVTHLPAAPWELANPLDINGQGYVVGDAETEDLTVDGAFVWDGEQYVLLPAPAGFSQVDAESINDLGQIVGWGWNGSFEAVVWENGEPFSLEELVRQYTGGADAVRKVFDLSETGWTAGWGTNPATGSTEFFRLKLGPPCPDPDSPEGMVQWIAQGGQFDDPDNWSTGEVPSTQDIVRFDAAGGGNVDVTGDLVNEALVLGTDDAGVSLDLDGHTWLLRGEDPCLPSLLTRTAAGGFGLFDLYGGRIDLEGGAVLEHGGPTLINVYDGQGWNVSGGPLVMGHADTTRLNLGGSSYIMAEQEVVLGLGTDRHAVLRLETANLGASRLVLGSRGTGLLHLTDGLIQAERVVLGEILDGHGEMTVAGSVGGLLLANQELIVGGGGDGRLEVTNTVIGSPRVEIGVEIGGTGTLFVEEEATLQATETHIGVRGNGDLQVLAGATYEQSEGGVTVVGTEPDGLGRLALVGPDVTTHLRDIVVGQAGHGTLSLENQAQLVVSGLLSVAARPGSEGEVTTQEGAILASRITVGGPEGGAGILTVAEGDVVVADALEVGPQGQVVGAVIALGVPTSQKARQDGIQVASLHLAAGSDLAVGDVVFGTGWILGGGGTLPFPVVNDALVEPGDPGLPGVLSVEGAYTQTATGRLHLELFEGGGPGKRDGEMDQLWVTGAVALAGTLRVDVAPGAAPEVGDRFPIVTGASLSGQFDAVVADPTVDVAVEYDATGAELVITGLPVAVDDAVAPAAFALSPVAPNPFNPRAEFSLRLPTTQHVKLRVVDLRGRVIATLYEGELAGDCEHRFVLDGTRWPSGVYLVQAAGEGVSATRKIVLVE